MMSLKLVNSIREGKAAMKNESGIIKQIMKNIVEKLRFVLLTNKNRILDNFIISNSNSKYHLT